VNPSRALELARVVGVVGLALMTAACVPPPKACTEIGATNGVRVTIAGFPRAFDAQARADEISVRACVGATCGTGAFRGAEEDSAWVDLPAVGSTDPVVTARDSAGAVFVPATTVRVVPRKVQPNGAGCEPTAFQAQVTVTPPARAVS
jgi:hypothetical protein